MRSLLIFGAAALAAAAMAAPASADELALGPVTTASETPSPFALPLHCGGPGEAAATSVNYLNAEVEPHLADHPTDPDTLVGGWQQDRWSDGGAHGLVFASSSDGGASWTESWPAFSKCAGGTATSAVQAQTLAPRPSDYERATDPWVSYGPDGRVHSIALVFDNSTPRNAVLTAFSDDDGLTWSAPRQVRFDNPRALGNNFNDKESLTADPGDADLVYATWQRIVSPSEQASGKAYENSVSYFSDAWFARSTDGGDTWEPAHSIFHPGRFQQTIGNQIDVLPDADGTLINGFNRIQAVSNRKFQRGYNVEILRSSDKGETWSGPIHVNRLLVDEVEDPDVNADCPDPDDDGGCDVRTGDIIPDFAVDRSGTATDGNLYAVWMDHRFNDSDHNDILLSRSEDGGLSWDPPVEVDQAPDGVDAFTATVDVDGAGRVGVSYYDFRMDEDDDDVLSTDLWLARSDDGGESFDVDDETRLTPKSFDMRTAPYALGYFVGDYTGLSHFGSRFDSLWVGANDGNLANRTDAFHRSGE